MHYAAAMKAVVLLLAVFGTAHADEEVPPAKSEDTAFLLSAGPTVGAAVLVGAGLGLRESNRTVGQEAIGIGVLALGITPSFGEWYSERYFTVGMGMRFAGTLIAGVGAIRGACLDLDCSSRNKGESMLVAGGLVFALGAVYDVATARGAARNTTDIGASRSCLPRTAPASRSPVLSDRHAG